MAPNFWKFMMFIFRSNVQKSIKIIQNLSIQHHSSTVSWAKCPTCTWQPRSAPEPRCHAPWKLAGKGMNCWRKMWKTPGKNEGTMMESAEIFRKHEEKHWKLVETRRKWNEHWDMSISFDWNWMSSWWSCQARIPASSTMRAPIKTSTWLWIKLGYGG